MLWKWYLQLLLRASFTSGGKVPIICPFLTDMIIFTDVKKNCSGLQALSPFGVMSLFQLSMWSISRRKGLKKQLQFVLLYRLICLCGQRCWVRAFQTGAVWWSAVTYSFKPSILNMVQSRAHDEMSICPIQPLSALQLVESWIDTNQTNGALAYHLRGKASPTRYLCATPL